MGCYKMICLKMWDLLEACELKQSPGMMAHICSPSTWEAGGSWVWGQPRLHSEFQVSLGCIVRPCFKKQKQTPPSPQNNPNRTKKVCMLGIWELIILFYFEVMFGFFFFFLRRGWLCMLNMHSATELYIQSFFFGGTGVWTEDFTLARQAF
jgi:hypothetical protein